jgi:L-lactate dehydrogenase complex protein LldE
MGPVQLFVTCLVDGFGPEVGVATVRVLENEGLTVEFPVRQTCCGQPSLNAGLLAQARKMAAHTVEVLDGGESPIVVPSGSCADMLIHHAPRLLSGGPYEPAARRVAERVRELTQFLVDDLGVGDIGANCRGCVAVYHPSCHGMRNLGIRVQPERLLDEVEDLIRVEPAEPEQCCGFGGLFSVEMPDVSAAILDAKLDDLAATGANTVVGIDLSCLLHIEGGLHRRGSAMKVRHIAEILAGDR